MADMTIDSLKLEIASSSAEAEKSLDNLTNSLIKLRVGLSGLDFKSTGINNFISSLKRLGSVTKSYNPESLNKILESLNKIVSASANMSSVSNFVKGINSIIRSTGKMKDTTDVFPTLSTQLKDFFGYMSRIEVSDNVARVAEALAEITKQGKKAGTSLSEVNKSANRGIPIMQSLSKGADMLINALKKIGGGAINGIKNLVMNLTSLGKTNAGVSSLTFNLKTLLATVIGFRGITGLFNWTKEAVTAGADLTEIDHIVESVFGKDMVGYVQEWSNNTLNAFGIAGTAAKKYAGTMSAMFQASNVGVKESNKMAMDLVELAGDLSAFYNIDTETAYNKLKSGMAGMVRPLRDLGLDISAATLKEYALAQGIEKSYSAMTQGEKMLLRYKYLMEQTSLQQGDFARTNGKLRTAA